MLGPRSCFHVCPGANAVRPGCHLGEFFPGRDASRVPLQVQIARFRPIQPVQPRILRADFVERPPDLTLESKPGGVGDRQTSLDGVIHDGDVEIEGIQPRRRLDAFAQRQRHQEDSTQETSDEQPDRSHPLDVLTASCDGAGCKQTAG